MAARPGLASGHAAAAALPGMLVHVLAADLAARYDAGHPDATLGTGAETADPPDPSAELRAAYQAIGQGLALTDPAGEIRTLGLALADQIETRRTWTGWALLAAAVALDEHADRLPVPGRPRRRVREQRARRGRGRVRLPVRPPADRCHRARPARDAARLGVEGPHLDDALSDRAG